MNVTQRSFVEGLDTISSLSDISENGYEWLINGRCRFGRCEPIKQHEELLALPAGVKQGLTSIGDVLIAFVSGKAYYKKQDLSSWLPISDFLMSTTAERFWTQAVPASTMNLVRKTSNGDAAAAIIKSADFNVAGTPSGLVVQDNINQPWLIFYQNGAVLARVTKNYGQWSDVSYTNDDREYVPVGNQMMFINAKLFIRAPNGKSFYQSVTGRPLDFVVAVDDNGKRLPAELDGGATSTSIAFDFEEITCLFPLNVADSFIYATSRLTRIITLDYNNTFYGEPTYRESARISAGIVNDESFIEIIGDYSIIDKESILSFNAVQQLNTEAKNSIFSLPITFFMDGIIQSDSRCVMHDNYALFSVRTKWGYAILVYDVLRDKWISADFTEVARVKQFTKIYMPDETQLYALNNDGRVFRMFAKTTTSIPQLKTRGYSPDEVSIEHKTHYVKPYFEGGTVEGECEIIEYVDGQRGPNAIVKQDLPSNLGGVTYPVIAPVGPDSVQSADTPAFVFKNSLTGKVISYVISWNTDAVLVSFQIVTEDVKSISSNKQKSLNYGS